MDQNSRNDVITKFKKKEIQILIATDVAGTIVYILFIYMFYLSQSYYYS